MELLLREIQSTGAVGEFVDRELSGDKITIGCANDQLIQLLGAEIAPQHAVLTPNAGGAQIKSSSRVGIEVNGEQCKSASLKVGDTFTVGGHKLTLAQVPAGFDAALELHRDPEVDPATFEQAFQTSLTDTWLSKRGPAWIVSIVVLALGLLIPLALILDGNEATPDPESAFLTDAYWTSGPLHAAHNVAIGDDCGACHTVPFQKVQDAACQTCHVDTDDHVSQSHFANSVAPPERCAVCHVEHNEPSFLIVEADQLCLDCHVDPGPLSDGPGHMRAVTGFDHGAHPSFEVAMVNAKVKKSGTGLAFQWDIIETLLDEAKEQSNLKFPHDLHLDAGSVQTNAEGRGMQCSDCHTLTADNEHFAPITMEAHCQSCHELTFDENAPQRQLPHGQPLEVIQVMEGHFARALSDPNRKTGENTRRRRPDRAANASACTGSVFACATQRTEAEVASQFAVRGCVTCHEVEDTGSDDIYSRFQVYPVRLSHDFIPTAKFDHRSHFTQKDASGDDACLTCHTAKESSVSHDLLIPGLGNCTTCHTDVNTADTVPLQCISCHQYHPLMAEPINYLERNL